MISSPAILIADDMELNRVLLREIFYNQYTILEADNGKTALEQIEQHQDQIVLVFLDAVMPVMDGFEVLNVMNLRLWIQHIPVIMISADDSDPFVLKGYELGVSDYIIRPFSPGIIKRRASNVIDLFRHKEHLEHTVLKQAQNLEQINRFMIDTLSTVVEFRNGESGPHTRRICTITRLLLDALMNKSSSYYFTNEDFEEISTAAALHDIGKIAVPEHILNKPGKLTAKEFNIMKTHTVKGAELLDNIDHLHDWTYFNYCYDICLSHHERWDGNGYPNGLKGNEIPIWAQIVSLADVYDALISERVYKEAYPPEVAIQMILNNECGVFNPVLLEALVSLEKTITEALDPKEPNVSYKEKTGHDTL